MANKEAVRTGELNQCPKCQEDEQEREAQHARNLELAEQLAEFMDNPRIAMDVWDFVGSSIEDLADKCGVGFHTPEVVRAAVPLILELSESRDMIMSLLAAVEKRRAADAALVAGRTVG
jgi:hypothetical protein